MKASCLTVVQQPTSAHHGLERRFHSIRWDNKTNPSWGQLQEPTSGFMGIDGFTSSTNEDNTSWFHSTFVMWNNPSLSVTRLIHQGFWDQHEWAINSDKSQVLWKPHNAKGWTSLHQPEAIAATTRTTVDHQEWWRGPTTSNDSTNTSGHIRSKTTRRQQWHLDDEQPRIHRAHSQAPKKSTFHTIQQCVSHQHRPTWGLPKDHH